MNLDEIQRRSREVFRQEATDLLRELEDALLALESDPTSAPLINRAFRVMHTLKGSGATSGFQELSDFLHRVEDVYNAARENRLAINSAIIDGTLKIADAVARYLAAAPADAPAVLHLADGDLAALLAFLPSATTPPSDRPVAPREAPHPNGSSPAAAAATAAPRYAIDFRPHPDLFRTGGDPGMFLDELRSLGPCTITGHADQLPPLADLDPESSYLRWEIELATDAGEAAVREVFAFVDGECDLKIARVPPAEAVRTWAIAFRATERTLTSPGIIDALRRDLERFGRLQVLSSPPAVGDHPGPGVWQLRLETAATVETIQSAFVFLLDAEPKLTPETPSATPAPTAPMPTEVAPRTAAAAPAKATVAKANAKNDTLRVSAERLDRLVNLVGELVILRSQVSTACAGATHLPPGLHGAAEALQSLSTEMRDVILEIRMMPIEQTFGKFRRLVRDLTRDLGKEVEMVVEGGETEMDKTVLDALADPLVHLVRNSLDHGLEPAAERVAAGKSPRGTLTLRAEQRGDRVLVIVADDGRGLNPEKIRAKAISSGLLASDANPTEAELFQMIFLPGFSTADTVSQVSGRGVGLDVVRRQLDQLRGRVEVRSERGRGAEFRLSLPLTLAIIEGLMVEVDGDRYVLPLGIARETIELRHAERTAGNARNLVELRGERVPYLRLRDVFKLSSAPPDPEFVVVVELEDQRLGLVVDRVIGNHQTVLKSLGWIGRRVPVFSGATVLGDGHIALILDVPALLALDHQARGVTRGLEI